MHDDPNLHGPHFDSRLIGANGKLSRLHKGSAPPPPVKPPPPVRETSRDVQQARQDEMAKAAGKSSYRRTLFGNDVAPEDSTGRKTLLGQ